MVDGRGTGFAGRGLRNPVRDDLGHWEVVDQIAAARDAAKRIYVDHDRIGIWGWVSYICPACILWSQADKTIELRRLHDL